MTHDQNLMAVMYRETNAGLDALAEEFRIGRSTVRRKLLEAGVELRRQGRPTKTEEISGQEVAER